VRRAFVVHGSDGLDEITTTGATLVAEARNGKVVATTITPEDFGLPQARPEDLVGGDREANAQILRDVLGGRKGPKRDIIVANAAAALVAAGKAENFLKGAKLAAESIDSGKARAKLNELVRFTSQFPGV